MAGRDPPPFLNTEEDRGAIVAVVSFTFVSVATLTNGIRVWIRQRAKGGLGLDDAFLTAANGIAIVQTGLVGASVKHGLGRHSNTLSDASISGYYKLSYASSILAILSMAFAKLSVLQLQRRICGNHSGGRYIKVMSWALAGFILAWTIFSVLALAFQCGITRPYIYKPDRCADGVLWYPVAVGNALTDAALAFSFSPIILGLETRTRMKVKLMVLLGTRVLYACPSGSLYLELTANSVCMVTIIQIVSLAQRLTGTDQTRAMITPVVLQQIVMNLSILTAVLLSLHGFIANLSAGGFGVEFRESSNGSGNGLYGKTKRYVDGSKGFSRRGHNQSTRDRQSRDREDGADLRPDGVGKSHAWARHEEATDLEDSDRRSDGSQENIIKQTVTWHVSSNADVSSVSRGDEELQALPPSGELRAARTRNFLR
ncbi:hypothetical protein LTR37_019698 [Vermiconidia calcicola]|uniref:Uncharacterized protein n=1 Tax=Vermiconidia calcicola TaxID=1690605 RepID=A0ACC3MDJ5_9PEZI|nr:hypothetical protein LTR37_019698 [Vermiconidia calcicola]